MGVTIVAALGGSSVRPPLYEARVELVVQAAVGRTRTALGDRQPARDSSRVPANEIRVLTSQDVRSVATQKLGFVPTVTARRIADTDVIRLAARAPTAERAYATANGYAAAYAEFRRTRTTEDILATSTEVERELRRLAERVDSSFGVEKVALQDQYRLFSDLLSQLQVDATGVVDQVRLLSPVSDAISRVRPGAGVVVSWAALVGLLLGVELALLFKYLDQSVTGRQDVERAGHGVPVLGVIPERADIAALLSRHHPSSLAAESYRSLLAVLFGRRREPPVRLLQVTGAGPGEGRTTTVAHLGVALAEVGRRVVMVDAHLHRPSLHQAFGLQNDVGLVSVASGTVPLTVALQKVSGDGRLSLLAAGPLRGGIAPSPSQVAAAVKSVGRMADIVLIDSPPVSAGAGALLLSDVVDCTVVVVQAGATRRRHVTRALEQLAQVEAPVAGLILNGASGDVEVLPRATVRA